ncbi:protein IQ-DOMAIN 32 [Silene latifolia]|uniref:protein IQ-DOMAIN 32 n=1 Tax=Silene latifolia TaxID=37657 RepID=UPI003D771F8D
MGKSSSCLKMVACGSNTATADSDEDDHHIHHLTLTSTTTTQTKSSPDKDKRGWSFRKKSGRHNLTSEPPSSFPDKGADFQSPLKSATTTTTTDDNKPLVPKNDDEKPQLPPEPLDDALPKPLSPQIQLTTPQPDDTPMLLEDATFDSPLDLGTVIQSAVPKDDFSEQFNSADEPLAITLQASIRGFLIRQQFLHLKNVVMLQAVIRGHLVRRNAVETLHCIQGIAKVQALVRAHTSKSLDQNYIKSEGQFSTAKLLKNSFARQLMESTPKPNTVNIRCDPFSPNSAWAWLERWMSVTSAELEKVNQVEPRRSEADIELSSRSLSDSFDSKSIVDEIKKSSEGNHVVDPIDSQSSPPFFVEKEQPDDHMAEEIYDSVNSVKMDALINVSSGSHIEPSSLPDEAATEIQQAKLCAKRSASEELNGEGKKLICGSRKASHLEVGADTFSSPEETCIRTSEPSVVGVDVPSDPRVIVAGSECGTELSITSTLDSPDRYELENAQPELQVKILETSAGCETNPMCDVRSETTQQEDVHEFPGGLSVSAVVAQVLPGLEQKSEIKASDELMKFPSVVSDVIEENEQKEVTSEQDACLEHVTGLPAEKLSPETSPRSHMTVPESHGTPSSQVSLKDKRNKVGKSGSNTKRSPLSASKRSPSNPNLESGSRSSVEHLAKDHKSGKRRNSFGSTKSDTDQEPRDSNSHNSVPSYMQATKSAKAKAHSPRSSPDFHDKEVNSKKRPTLSAAGGGRQGSPRVQRSPSEGVQGAKTNGSHPSNERKWQR